MSEHTRDEGPLPGRLGALADEYHRPPTVPREAMWEAIEGRVRAEAARRREAANAPVVPLRRRVATWGAWAAAAAAVLVVGVGIGRLTGPAAPDGRTAAVEPPAADDALRAAASEHLSRSQDLLTLVRTDARSGRVDPAVGRWGRELLVETRLLLDSSAGSDPALRPLLEDLELLLAQVALLAGEGMEEEGRAREEMDIIARGLDASDVLPRIEAALPAAPGLSGT